MRIEALNADRIQEVMELFCTCFRDDHYYKRMFPNDETRCDDIINNFSKNVLYCIEKGISYGLSDGGKLIGFILAFDYFFVKNDNPKAFYEIFGAEQANDSSLPYYKQIHEKIIEKNDSVFLLSVAVKEDYRRMGLASLLVDEVVSQCKNKYIVGDVSNQASLGIYEKRGFEIEKIDNDYFLVSRCATTEQASPVQERVCVAVPNEKIFKTLQIDYKILKKRFPIPHVAVKAHFGNEFFQQEKHNVAFGVTAEIDYKSLLKFQRYINLSQNEEYARENAIYYILNRPYENELLYNPRLKEMLPSRRQEWGVIPDTYVMVPVEYKNRERIVSAFSHNDEKANELLHLLDFRTKYEVGTPSDLKNVDESSHLKGRIQRFYLGKLLARIYDEINADNYEIGADTIGAPAYIDVYITLDAKSECAVVTWYSLSTPFLISHYMDNVIRNQVSVFDGENWVNIYEYLNCAFGVMKRGTPKIFVVIPENRDCLKDNQLASMLAAETIYPDGEDFGNIVDEEIVSAVTSENGMGQYDRGFVCAYTNSVLQFSPDMVCDVKSRLCEESITLFYIELILLEESAIHIADLATTALFTSKDFEDPIELLKHIESIYDSYSKTIEFWDVQVNYPTSKKSIMMLRNAFKVDEQLRYLTRNQEQLKLVFDTKSDIVDRTETRRMNTSLAVISAFAVFSAWMDSHDYLDTWKGLLPETVVSILQRSLFVAIGIIAVAVVYRLFGIGMVKNIKRRVKKLSEKRKNK